MSDPDVGLPSPDPVLGAGAGAGAGVGSSPPDAEMTMMRSRKAANAPPPICRFFFVTRLPIIMMLASFVSLAPKLACPGLSKLESSNDDRV